MLSMPPMPETTVQKITNVITILMSLMKASPSGLSSTPKAGQKWPIAAPSAMAKSTCTYSTR